VAGDVVEWGGLRLEVVAAPERGLLKARVRRVESEQPEEPQ